MKKNHWIIISLLISFFSARAEVIITDAEDGTVLSKASIFDKNGYFIGVTNDDGSVPAEIDAGLYPLNIRYVGYEPIEVATPDLGVVKLVETTYDLPEVTIDAESHNLFLLTAYVRSYITQVTDKDTIVSFDEQIIDFMFPVTKKAKFKGWKKARLLGQRAYKQGKNNKRDTVVYGEGTKGGSYSFKLSEKFVLPDAMAAGNSIMEIVPGKHSDKEIWKKIGDTYHLELDDVADYENHIFKPAIAKMLGMSMELLESDWQFKFKSNDKNNFTPEDVLEASVRWHLKFTGKVAKWAYETKNPIDFYGYGEMFVIDRAYLTAEDAKELKKNPPVIDLGFKAPENIPLPPPQMVELKERVLKENPNAR